jgi:hypothetical protein
MPLALTTLSSCTSFSSSTLLWFHNHRSPRRHYFSSQEDDHVWTPIRSHVRLELSHTRLVVSDWIPGRLYSRLLVNEIPPSIAAPTSPLAVPITSARTRARLSVSHGSLFDPDPSWGLFQYRSSLLLLWRS